MDLGTGREGTDPQQQQKSSHQTQQQQQPQPLSPLPAPLPLLMPQPLAVSNFHSAPPPLQQHHQHHQLHHEIPSSTKLKLLNTSSGNGGSVPSKGDHVGADQAREILRQAVQGAAAGNESASTKPSNVKKGTVRYRECQKNHAASIGGHALDGCGEFMPGGEEGTVDALRCAACDCHRNFHRREVEGEVLCECKRKQKPGVQLGAAVITSQHPPGGTIPSTPMATLALPPSAGVMTPLTMAALSTGGPTDSDEQDDGLGNSGGGMMMSMRSPSAIKKRFRTKFTNEQKDQMCAFAEKVGWRIQKHDEASVQEFCATAGIKRHVLKVWMHNNKHTMGKKPT
ncbi:zinc-finger homeodomain protein 1 [Physcomitrium patens]|uniref:ZF-HD dimerization-type domain-containing protein n=1 Tax=Physcomitrium patens TaxID=3218 RepID=A0A2K1J0V6_PHYPA|nr:zinc-finger homeodomain protein 1-like [Physcomitrium patens]PNR35159.1 hypothetical protein PHYPA_023058 [Physcomitrium patens]|eukprot:XP_024402412.1 zinc-finger homeodomain protein 1-like [Physcomitrella patens]